ESTGEMRQFSVRRHLSSASGKGGQWVVHPVDSNTFPYRVQATIKHNVLLNCLRLFFIMGRKGGFSCPGGEQKLLMELFRENNESMSGYFHAWVASKSLLMDVFCVKKNAPTRGALKQKRQVASGNSLLPAGQPAS
ncbi:hypothetical protein, partial [Geobacillus stearothermophilus]|uniref:hypothetical protein n=3 Tax=Geobacillus stearothermophilus TaxID=1422 RepID=UPI002E1ED849|nr:hypothetical protein [Geobacillus stearothermophilus]